MLSCALLDLIKVLWTWEDKEQVPVIKYLPKIDLVLQYIQNKFFCCYLLRFLSVWW